MDWHVLEHACLCDFIRLLVSDFKETFSTQAKGLVTHKRKYFDVDLHRLAFVAKENF